MSRRVELVIDEVVLHGVDASDARVVIAALESELEHRAAAWASSGGALVSRDEASRRVAGVEGNPSPSELGAGLATAVWRAVAGGAG